MLMQCHGGMVPLEDGSASPILTIGSGPVGGMVGTQRLAAELGHRERHRHRHGRHELRRRDHRGPRAARSPPRRVLGKYTLQDPRRRGHLDRRGRRLDRLGRGALGHAARRPAQRELEPRARRATASAARSRRSPTPTSSSATSTPRRCSAPRARARSGPIATSPRQAIQRVAEPLGLSVTDAALGIAEIVDAKMANLLENVVVGRGFDPRDFTIFSFGGSGAIHAAGYARELGHLRGARSPARSRPCGAPSASRSSDIRHTQEGDVQLVSPIDAGELAGVYEGIEDGLLEQFGDGAATATSKPELKRYARMRYEWQRNELEVGVPTGALDDETLKAVTADFEERYEQRYGVGGAAARRALRDRQRAGGGVRADGHRRQGAPAERRAATTQKASRLVAFKRGEEPQETPGLRRHRRRRRRGDLRPGGHRPPDHRHRGAAGRGRDAHASAATSS